MEQEAGAKSNNKLNKKIIEREKIRLKLSLEEGKKLQESLKVKKDILVAMHFPPFISNYPNILKEYDVKLCIYGHLHRLWKVYDKRGNNRWNRI